MRGETDLSSVGTVAVLICPVDWSIVKCGDGSTKEYRSSPLLPWSLSNACTLRTDTSDGDPSVTTAVYSGLRNIGISSF